MSGSVEDLEEIQLWPSQEEEQGRTNYDGAIRIGTHANTTAIEAAYCGTGEDDEWEVLSSEEKLEDSGIVVDGVLSSSTGCSLSFESQDDISSSARNYYNSATAPPNSTTATTSNNRINNTIIHNSIPACTYNGTTQHQQLQEKQRVQSMKNNATNPIEILSSHDDDDDTSSHVVIPTPEEISISTEDFEMSHVLVSPTPTSTPPVPPLLLSPETIRRVASFKDAVLFQLDCEQKLDNSQEKHIVKPRIKPKFVVSPIRRCSKSTGDLQSLAASIVEEEDYDIHSACGGKESQGNLGASDAMEYYHQKNHGFLSWKNGKKIRPDEAKRKEMTIQKKHLQRQQQQQQQQQDQRIQQQHKL